MKCKKCGASNFLWLYSKACDGNSYRYFLNRTVVILTFVYNVVGYMD